jgi:very-short-patch-repair endonuclease
MIKGRKLTDEHKRKLSEYHRTKVDSKEHKENISNGLKKFYQSEDGKKLRIIKKQIIPKNVFKKGMIPWNKGLKIKKWREEDKKKLKGRKSWNKGLKGEEYKSHYLNGFSIPNNLGKHHSKESKLKIGLSHKGKHHSEESKRKMSQSLKGHFPYRKGKHHTEESLIKMREARAKQIFPIKDTSIEIKIQNFLKELNIEFYPHQYMREIEHKYQCDVFIPSINLIIECDGNYWHNFPFGREIDYIRTKELQDKGFNVLRLWERDIKKMDIIEFKDKLQEVYI